MIGRALKDLRKNTGMTLAEVADAIGVHEVTVSRWENGKRQPSEDKINDLLDCYGVDRNTFDNLARK